MHYKQNHGIRHPFLHYNLRLLRVSLNLDVKYDNVVIGQMTIAKSNDDVSGDLVLKPGMNDLVFKFTAKGEEGKDCELNNCKIADVAYRAMTELELPLSSDAVYETVVTPSGNVLPLS